MGIARSLPTVRTDLPARAGLRPNPSKKHPARAGLRPSPSKKCPARAGLRPSPFAKHPARAGLRPSPSKKCPARAGLRPSPSEKCPVTAIAKAGKLAAPMPGQAFCKLPGIRSPRSTVLRNQNGHGYARRALRGRHVRGMRGNSTPWQTKGARADQGVAGAIELSHDYTCLLCRMLVAGEYHRSVDLANLADVSATVNGTHRLTARSRLSGSS